MPSEGTASDTEPQQASDPADLATVGAADAPTDENQPAEADAAPVEVQESRPDPLAVMLVFDITVELPTPHALLTLREVDAPHRLLVIPIGQPEGTALALAWRGVPTLRPVTHELFSDVLTRLGATIDAVRLTGRHAGVVLAEIEISSPRGREVVSARPTDCLTLAIRQGVPAPILVDPRLFDVEGDVEPRRAVSF
jgi:bifunctional DNase/RNase